MQATGLATSQRIADPRRSRPELLPRSRKSISEGRVVSMRYTMTLDNGRVVETKTGETPFAYLHGAGNVVPGLERELHQCQVGDRLHVSVPPELGFGKPNPDHVRRIPRTEFPPDAQLTPGMRFRSQLDDGSLLPRMGSGPRREDRNRELQPPLGR